MNKQPPLSRFTRTMPTGSNEEYSTKPTPRVPSEALLGERGELIIEHAGREYRLRRTSLGKLMLTA